MGSGDNFFTASCPPNSDVSKVETRNSVPTLRTLGRLAQALEVTVPDLLSDSEAARSEKIAALVGDPFIAEIAACLPRLSAAQKQVIQWRVRQMAAPPRLA